MKRSKAHILVVDDKQSVLSSLELFLNLHFEHVHTLNNPNQLMRMLEKEPIDLILLDMNFTAGINSGNEGIYWLKQIKEKNEHIAVILITAYGDIDLAVSAIKDGASDFLLKPWDNQRLLSTINNALKLKSSEEKYKKTKQELENNYKEAQSDKEFYIGNSELMKQLDTTITKIAPTDASILILGENGVGKEVVANEIRKRSDRALESMIRVDLGSLSETLFESELFGHVKGAFTDARESRMGRFELASGGTLFLDVIGNLSPFLQAKLLTALENRKITPIGSNHEIPIDVRLISATNKNLLAMVENGNFREDLYFRLNTITIEIPPLRNRKKDIVILAEKFLFEFSSKYEKGNLKIAEEAKSELQSYSWPGNIRELRHTIEKAVILCESQVITVADLHVREKPQTQPPLSEEYSMDEWEKIIIEKTLKDYNYNISDTAKSLKIGRQTLYRKIEKYGLQ